MAGHLRNEQLGLVPVACALAFVLSFHFFVQPLRPWPDQGWMLQSAIRHAHGLGLTTQMGAPLHDMARPEFVRLTYFPPLYPWVVSALIRAGLNVEIAVKLINLVAMIFGVFGWIALAIRVLQRPVAQWVFALLLVIAGAATIPKGGTADYIYWASMGWWVLAVLESRRAIAAHAARRAVMLAAVASIVAAMLIGVRWAAVVLVPAGALALLWPERGWWPEKRRIALAVGYGIPATAAYFGITLVNRLLAGSGSSLQSMMPGWRFSLLATTYPLQSVFGLPLAIQPLLDRVWRLIDSTMTSVALAAFFRVILPMSVVIAIIVLARRGGRDREGADSKGFLVVAATIVTVWVGFLAFMTVRYTWDFVDWSYLDEPRYFRPIWPLMTLVWLVVVERFNRAWRRVVYVAISLCALYSLQAMIRWEHQWLTEPDESWELVEEVLSLERRAGLHLIVDNDVSDYVIRAGENLVAFGYPAPERLAELEVSRPAELWLVRRVNEKTAYMLDPEFDVKRFEAMRARFRPELAWTSSAGSYEMWHARIGEGDAEQ